MRKAHVRLMLAMLLAVAGIALALFNTSAVFSLGSQQYPERSALFQEITPTATAVQASQPGSTAGIEWMGLAIVVIILLPIVLRRRTWSRN